MHVFRTTSALVIAALMVSGWTAIEPSIRWPASSPSPVTYYVSPFGHDTASGRSPATAWRTLTRASSARLLPGERLLLRGGYRYAGSIFIGKGEAGNPAKPVLISSYGKGSAVIQSGGSGIVIEDTAGVTVRNLVIVGQNAMKATTAGIQVFSNLVGKMLSHIFIDRVNVTGFGYGVAIGGLHDGGGFQNVSVTSSVLHGNLDAGLSSYGPAWPIFHPALFGYANANIRVRGVRAYGNLGDPANVSLNTGSGIVLGSVKGAAITYSLAYHNGGAGGAPQQGPEGIWAYDATGVVIAHNVSHDNSTRTPVDGGGFGFDEGTTNSVIEYNRSYHNHGPGYMLFGVPGNPERGNVVRFNISASDGFVRHNVGGLAIGGYSSYLTAYQNTVVMARTGTQIALRIYGYPHGVRVFNNIFVSSAAGPLVYSVFAETPAAAFLAGNDYHATGPWIVRWGSRTFRSIKAWRTATREEIVRGRRTGLTAGPLFVGPVYGVAGDASGAGFMLRPRSPLRRAGLNLQALFRLRPGPVYFSGTPYRLTRPDVGAQA